MSWGRQCGVISNKQLLYCRVSHQNRQFCRWKKGSSLLWFSCRWCWCTGSWSGCEIIFIAIIFIILTGFITTAADSVSTVDISPTSIAPSTLYSHTIHIASIKWFGFQNSRPTTKSTKMWFAIKIKISKIHRIWNLNHKYKKDFKSRFQILWLEILPITG